MVVFPVLFAADDRHIGNIFFHRHVREKPFILNHIADPAPKRDQIRMRHVSAFHKYSAFVRFLQAVDHAQHCRLSAAGSADHGKELSFFYRKAYVVKHFLSVKTL